MRNRVIGVLSIAPALALALPTAALAQAGADPSPWTRLIAWLFTQQREFQQGLTATLSALAETGGAAAFWGLVVTGFTYGVFHAAGPGHGKVVLTTYLLTQKGRADRPVLRGMALAAAAAFLQGLMALVIVYGLVYLAGWLPRDTQAAVDWSERTAFLLVALMGVYLAFRAVRAMWRVFAAPAPAVACDDCGHGHVAPTGDQIARASSPYAAFGVVMSMGLRPCTGAVLVLIFARISGVPWAGVAATAAIAAGTALAVGTLAFVAVNARELAVSTAGTSPAWRLSANAIAFGGGALLVAVGASLLAASFAPAHPLGL